MPDTFTTWTVLPHEPIRRLSDNLWTVDGMLGDIPRRMTLVRLRDGRVLVHNAVALDEPQMKELEAWGDVAALLVPNAFHRQDVRIWKDRYPKAKVYCPSAATKAVKKVVDADGSFTDAPQDDTVRVRHLAGVGDAEGVLEVQGGDGLTVVLNDVVANSPPGKFPMSFVLGPMGQPCVPRIVRWMLVKKKTDFVADLGGLATRDGLRRVVMSHGKVFEDDPKGQLQAALGTM